jgi:hypothetical protein
MGTFKVTNKYNAGNEQQGSLNMDTNTSDFQILQQLDKVLCKCFTTMCSEGKPETGLTVLDKAKSFCNEMKIIDTYSVMAGCKITV